MSRSYECVAMNDCLLMIFISRVKNPNSQSQPGLGLFSDTTFVTFCPRYQLENRFRHRLQFAQKPLVDNLEKSVKHHVTAADDDDHDNLSLLSELTSKCSMGFHWPRDDLDPILSLRLATDESCLWSGGFLIDRFVLYIVACFSAAHSHTFTVFNLYTSIYARRTRVPFSS